MENFSLVYTFMSLWDTKNIYYRPIIFKYKISYLFFCSDFIFSFDMDKSYVYVFIYFEFFKESR